MSFSDASEAEPRSHNLRTVFCSFTWYNDQQDGGEVKNKSNTYQDIIGLDISVHDIRFS